MVIPRRSVCMATYNGDKYLKEQLDSILLQLQPNDELIVSDDGSSDLTLSIIASYDDQRVKIVHNTGKNGPVYNFENALKHATGDMIFLSDQDDVWFSDKLHVMCAYLDKYDLVNCDCQVVDSNLKELSSSYTNFINSGTGFFKNFVKNTYIGNCMAFRRNVLTWALPFPENISYHDWWIALVAELFFKTAFLNESLGLHRRHGGNESNTFDQKRPSSLVVKLKKRYYMAKGLSGLIFKKVIPNS